MRKEPGEGGPLLNRSDLVGLVGPSHLGGHSYVRSGVVTWLPAYSVFSVDVGLPRGSDLCGVVSAWPLPSGWPIVSLFRCGDLKMTRRWRLGIAIVRSLTGMAIVRSEVWCVAWCHVGVARCGLSP